MRLIGKATDFAEKRNQAFIVPETMFCVLLDDDKCSELVRTLSQDEDKGMTLVALKDEVEKYLDENVEQLEDGMEIQTTLAFYSILKHAHVMSQSRSVEPDSLYVFAALFKDKEQASIHYLSVHGINEKDVFEYVRTYHAKERNTPGTENLSKYAVNLNNMARDGKIDPLIGRDKDIERIAQILARKRGSCPCLVGEAGTGKSAVGEGLALKIYNNAVPKSLINKTIYALDLASMVAGTKFRGEFEDRLEKTIKEVAGNEDIILFIDELHTIVGAGASEGAMDAGNILKPYLARGQVRIIGATTYEEYKAKIEKDHALCRRFKKIDILEPTQEETFKILQGLRPRYEEYHGIKFSDDVLRLAVELSGRFVVGKFFPDKAIDVIDEVGSKYHAGLKGGEEATKTDVEEVICSIANIPKISIETDDKQKLKTLGDRIKKNLYGQDEIVDKIVRQVKLAKTGLANKGKPLGIFMLAGPTGVGKTELARTLANELGIGMTKLDMSEYREEYSVSKLIGSAAGYVGYEQSGALTEPLIKMPHQVLLLDEIEKAHSSVLNLLLQVFDDGKLTDNHNREASFKNAIILMTTNVGYANASRTSATVGFVKNEKDDAKRTNAIIEESYKKTFSPEFRNRLTGVCYFHNLDEKVMGQIVDKDVRKVEDNLADKHVSIVLSPEARQWIITKSVAEKAGGRPVERIVNEQVTERISEKLIDGDIDEEKGGTVNVSVAENGEELEIGFESN